MTNVPSPPTYPILHSELFPNDEDTNIIDLNALKKHLKHEGRLHISDALQIITKATDLVSKEPNILRLNEPISICGNIRGQYWDFLRAIEAGGDPRNREYLFLGNYVNRGCFGMEVILYLCAHKIMFPNTFHLLRGNMDCRTMTDFFNFKSEVIYKYSAELYESVMGFFDNLPISALINGNIFCVSGGLSPDLSTLAEIENIDRFKEIPTEGPLCDLMWSDPVSESEYETKVTEDIHTNDSDSNGEPITWFAYNEARQCSYVFGTDAVRTFVDKNDLITIIRSHGTPFPSGYNLHKCYYKNGNPQIITISSAPRHDSWSANHRGALLKIDCEQLNIRQFVPAPHPYYLPNFVNVFEWSMPFVAEKVTDLIYEVLNYRNEENLRNNAHFPFPKSDNN